MGYRSGMIGLCLAVVLGGGINQAQAVVTVTVNNIDGAGEGFNDPNAPNAASTAAGNAGVNLGAQRLASFQAAANAWGTQLNGNVTVNVNAQMNDTGDCAGGLFGVGSAGPQNFLQNFAAGGGNPAPLANTLYPVAVANKIANTDLDVPNPDINATFNSQLDTAANCAGARWLYALDNRIPPAGTINFFNTVLHELGHGLCVISLVAQNGTLALDPDGLGPLPGVIDIFTTFIEHHGVGLFGALTDGQRAAAQLADPALHFVSPTVQANLAGANLTGGVDNGHPQLFGPNPFQPGSSTSHWDEDFIDNTTKHEFMEPIGDDNSGDLLTRFLCQDIGWGALNGVVPVELQQFSID